MTKNRLHSIRHQGTRLALLLGLALAITGCAINPTVAWTPPAEPAAANAPIDSMEGARAYAAAYKRALIDKAREYSARQTQLNDSLLGLGLLTAGVLAGKMHKDAALGASFLFGGAYLYGQQNLGAPRLQVYQSGISATNCAVAAVTPLNFSAGELSVVASASQALVSTDLPALGQTLARARQVYAASTIDSATRTQAIDQQLKAASDTYQAGLALLADSAQLPGRVGAAASGLKRAVDDIAAQTDRLVSNTVVDPASVSRSLGGLAAIVTSVAPGAGLGAAFASALSPQGTKTMDTPPAANRKWAPEIDKRLFGMRDNLSAPREDGLVEALAALGQAQARVDAAVRYWGGRIAASKEFGGGAAAALQQCEIKVGDSLLALRIEPDTQSVAKPAAEPVLVEFYASGGAKNYAGRIVPARPGVELVAPRPGEGTFMVRVGKDAPAEDINLRIEDSSNPPQVRTVKITVKPK